MSLQEVLDKHREVLAKSSHAKDDAECTMLSLLSPLNKFTKALVTSRNSPAIGIDYRQAVTQALGDMLLYLNSLSIAESIPLQVDSLCYTVLSTADAAAFLLLDAVQNLCYTWNDADELTYGDIADAVSAVLASCAVCLVDPIEAAQISLDAIQVKWSL